MVPKNERFPIQTVDADFANADKIIALALTTYQLSQVQRINEINELKFNSVFHFF